MLLLFSWSYTCVVHTQVIIVFMASHLCGAYTVLLLSLCLDTCVVATQVFCRYGLTPVWCIRGVMIVVMA